MANSNLGAAKKAKNDEFYTQYHDIEKEMNAYLDFDPDVFREKTILLPCDDPEWSNFTKYFAQNFDRLGLRKLISTSFAPNSKPEIFDYQPTLFEFEDPKFDKLKTKTKGKIFTLEIENKSGRPIDVDDLKWNYLEGDGDFQSDEVTRLLGEADVVITNPPFSLFRDFLVWITKAKKDFVLIGNLNAITYSEVFPLIKENKMWLGATNFNEGMYFFVPKGFKYADSYKFDREQNGKAVNRVPGLCWYTTLDHGRRHEPLPLMTMEDNLKFSKRIDKNLGYKNYDNYDAIEVGFTELIPSDYPGKMGVPITFLGKYNPEQFEIVGSFNAGSHGDELGATKTEILMNGKISMWNGPVVNRQPMYKRIVIRHKKAENEN